MTRRILDNQEVAQEMFSEKTSTLWEFIFQFYAIFNTQGASSGRPQCRHDNDILPK